MSLERVTEQNVILKEESDGFFSFLEFKFFTVLEKTGWTFVAILLLQVIVSESIGATCGKRLKEKK